MTDRGGLLVLGLAVGLAVLSRTAAFAQDAYGNLCLAQSQACNANCRVPVDAALGAYSGTAATSHALTVAQSQARACQATCQADFQQCLYNRPAGGQSGQTQPQSEGAAAQPQPVGGEPIGPDQSTASVSQTEDWIRRAGPQMSQTIHGNSIWTFPSKCRLRIAYTQLAEESELNLSALDSAGFFVMNGNDLGHIYLPRGIQTGRGLAWPDGYCFVVLKGQTGRTFSYGVERRTGYAARLRPDLHPELDVGLAVADHESGTRLARALKHLAILCGANADPF
jgi:hypothetical protein